MARPYPRQFWHRAAVRLAGAFCNPKPVQRPHPSIALDATRCVMAAPAKLLGGIGGYFSLQCDRAPIAQVVAQVAARVAHKNCTEPGQSLTKAVRGNTIAIGRI